MEMAETLWAQQKLLHKLYIDLEAEREASATAASEALSMILRLQEEKASDKLEASQFKRMVQEKMNHADEIMLVFEDVIHQKEMEVASLEFQVQAYRYKMLSMGLCDSEIGECRNSGVLSGDLVGQELVPSLPASPFMDLTPMKGVVHIETPATSLANLRSLDYEFEGHNKDVQTISEESAVGDLISYWEQIKELDERVKELSRGKATEERIECDRVSSNMGHPSTCSVVPEELQTGRRSSLSSAVSDPIRGVAENELDYQCVFPCSSSQANDHENLLQLDYSSVPCFETENTKSSSQSMSIHDVFEVPQHNDNCKPCPSEKQEAKKLILLEENRLGKSDPITHGTTKYSCADQAGCLKSSVQCVDNETKWTKPREGVSVNCHLTLVDLANGFFPIQNDFKQLNKRLDKLEEERRNMKQEVSGHEEENMKLLKEMQEQLNTIQSEIRSTKSETHPVADEPSLVSLMEERFFYSV